MAYLKLYREKLRHNYAFLQQLFARQHIEWGIVTKLFCGNEAYIKELIELGAREIHDSRVSNLQVVKSIEIGRAHV